MKYITECTIIKKVCIIGFIIYYITIQNIWGSYHPLFKTDDTQLTGVVYATMGDVYATHSYQAQKVLSLPYVLHYYNVLVTKKNSSASIQLEWNGHTLYLKLFDNTSIATHVEMIDGVMQLIVTVYTGMINVKMDDSNIINSFVQIRWHNQSVQSFDSTDWYVLFDGIDDFVVAAVDGKVIVHNQVYDLQFFVDSRHALEGRDDIWQNVVYDYSTVLFVNLWHVQQLDILRKKTDLYETMLQKYQDARQKVFTTYTQFNIKNYDTVVRLITRGVNQLTYNAAHISTDKSVIMQDIVEIYPLLAEYYTYLFTSLRLLAYDVFDHQNSAELENLIQEDQYFFNYRFQELLYIMTLYISLNNGIFP